MTVPGLRLLHRGEKGITLIEMLVVVALMGIIAAGIAMTISQVMAVNSRSSSHMIALRQVQQAGDRISKDVLQSRTVRATNGRHFPLTLQWLEFKTDDDTGAIYEVHHQVVHELVNPSQSGELRDLRREHSTSASADGPWTVVAVNTVARYIVEDDEATYADWDSDEHQLVLKVTAKVGQRTESRTYEIMPRPGS